MATKFQTRRTSTPGKVPTTSDIDIGELGINLIDQIAYSSNGNVVFELGANIGTQVVRTALYVGDNVDLTTTGLFIGNTSVNLIVNSSILTLANSTVNTNLTLPTSGQYSATNYFLHANGNWVQITSSGSIRVYQSYTATAEQTVFSVSGGYTVNQIEVFRNGVHLANTEYSQDGSDVTLNEGVLAGDIIEVAGWIAMGSYNPVAGGTNTQIQFNDSTVFGGSDGLVFNKITNTVTIANTLTIGSATINSTKYSQTANNADYLGGTAAADYQTEAGLAANVATLTANNANNLGGSISANSTGMYPTSNTAGNVLGNTTTRWVITANSITLSGDSIVSGFVNAITSVNSALLTVGSSFIANTTGIYHTDLVNAASYNATGFIANSTGVYANSVVNAASHTSTNFIANSSGVYHSGVINTATFSVGTAFTANSSVCNAVSFNVGTSSVVNSTVISSGGSLLSANVQINPQTDTYSLVAGDSGKVVPFTNASAKIVTVPASLPVGFRCQVIRMGAGTLTLSNTGSTGLSIYSRTGAFAITSQYGSASVFQANSSVAIIDGNI